MHKRESRVSTPVFGLVPLASGLLHSFFVTVGFITASVKSAPSIFPLASKVLPVKYAASSTAFFKFVFVKSASSKPAVVQSAPVKSASFRSALKKRDPRSTEAAKLASFATEPLKSFFEKSWLLKSRFEISELAKSKPPPLIATANCTGKINPAMVADAIIFSSVFISEASFFFGKAYFFEAGIILRFCFLRLERKHLQRVALAVKPSTDKVEEKVKRMKSSMPFFNERGNRNIAGVIIMCSSKAGGSAFQQNCLLLPDLLTPDFNPRDRLA